MKTSKKEFKEQEPTVRELMALHRAKPLCSSCHSRMDPLGLALENFNALGLWREKESGQPIDASGQLITGESFHDVRDLKQILKERHRLDFYRCLTEKLLTYALGRGLEYHDVETVDRIVERLDREGGRFSALLMGVIESAPFQKRRDVATPWPSDRPGPSETQCSRADSEAMKPDHPHDDRPAARRRTGPEPPPLPPGRGRCPGPARLRITRRCRAGPRRPPARPALLATTPTGAPLRMAFVYVPNGVIQVTGGPKGRGRTSSSTGPCSRWSRSRTRSRSSAGWTSSTPSAARTAPATMRGPAGRS